VNRTIRRFTILLAAAVLAAGCQTIDPYTGETKTSSATKGAAIGAGAGAVLGILTGDDSKERRNRALIGAGVGALAGGAVGSYMDNQEKKLREQLQGTGVSVTRVGDEIILNMPGNVTFQTDSSDLNPQFFSVLDSVALVLQEFDKTIIEVAGHTDSPVRPSTTSRFPSVAPPRWRPTSTIAASTSGASWPSAAA
jgi:outer membrane protein OmpA-like peptidoglycan-associated protein